MNEEEKAKQKLRERAKRRTKSEFTGFLEFVRTQGVVGLAIGFVIGAQAKVLVDQFTYSFVNPLLGLIVGSADGLTGKAFHLTVAGNTATFGWGAFVYSLINFMVIAAIIYFTFKWLKLDKLDKKKD